MRKLIHYLAGAVIAICAAIFCFYLLALLMLFNFTLPASGLVKIVLSLVLLVALPVWVWLVADRQVKAADVTVGWRWVALPLVPMIMQLSIPFYLLATVTAS